jgi:hypothetical protein
MPTPTYTLIASSTVGSGGSSAIDFTSIPGTYTDLAVFFSSRAVATSDFPAAAMRFNSSSTSYSGKFMLGSGSAASSGNTGTNYVRLGNANGSQQTASTFSDTYAYIPNYTSSANKSVSIDMVSENNNSAAYANLTAALWSNSAAITSISLFIDGFNLAQYSTAYLYGIVKS